MAQNLIQDLQRKIDKLKKENRLLISQTSAPTSAPATAPVSAAPSVDVSKFETQIQLLQSTVQQKEGQLQQKDTQLQEKDGKLTSLQHELEKLQVKAQQSSGSSSSDLIMDLNRKIDKYKSTIKKQKKELDQFAALADSKSIIDSLESRMVQFSNEISVRDETIQQNNTEISILKAKIADLQKDDKAAQLVDKTNEIFKLKSQLSTQSDQAKFKEEQITSLNQEINDLKANDLGQQLQKKEDTLLLVKSQLQKEKEKNEELETQAQDFAHQITELQKDESKTQIQELMTENTNLKRSVESRLLQIKNINAELEKRDIKITTLETLGATDAVLKFEQENARLEEESENMKRRLELTTERLRDLEDEMQNAGTYQQSMRIRELRSLLDELKKRSRQSQLEINHWKKKALAMGEI